MCGERSRTFASREKPQALEQAKARGACAEAGSTKDYQSLSKGKVASSIMEAPSLQKRNIPLARQIKFVTRSLRRSAPCPHCIRSAHFNRVRLRASPFAQDDALKVMQCEQNHYPFGKLILVSVLGGGTKTLAGAIA